MGASDFSPEEIHTIDSIIWKLSKHANSRHSLTILLTKWHDFVTQIEVGYNNSIYDYTNELSIRDVLEELLEQLPNEIKGKLSTVLKPLDDRYMEATNRIQRSLSLNPQRKAQSWWYRIPKRLGPELRADLQSEGFLQPPEGEE